MCGEGEPPRAGATALAVVAERDITALWLAVSPSSAVDAFAGSRPAVSPLSPKMAFRAPPSARLLWFRTVRFRALRPRWAASTPIRCEASPSAAIASRPSTQPALSRASHRTTSWASPVSPSPLAIAHAASSVASPSASSTTRKYVKAFRSENRAANNTGILRILPLVNVPFEWHQVDARRMVEARGRDTHFRSWG